jgi:hypothetical protein
MAQLRFIHFPSQHGLSGFLATDFENSLFGAVEYRFRPRDLRASHWLLVDKVRCSGADFWTSGSRR